MSVCLPAKVLRHEQRGDLRHIGHFLSKDFSITIALMDRVQGLSKRRLNHRIDRSARLKPSCEHARFISDPGDGEVTAAQAIEQHWILRATAVKQGGAARSLKGHPLVYQVTGTQQCSSLFLCAEDEPVVRIAKAEPAYGRHGEEEVTERSGMEQDDRACHAAQDDSGRIFPWSERAARRSAGVLTL